MAPTGVLSSARIPWTWILIIAGAILYIPFIGGVSLFDWDEINFAEISREMIMTGDYLNIQVDYKPFFEKPPLFFWLQVLCMKVFGINEFAARLPNAIAGSITLVLLFKTGSDWINHRFGVLWALAYMGSILPSLYHKSGIIDPWFNLFIFGGIITWVKGSRATENSIKWFVLSGILSGLAVLTKGPVGPLLIGLTIFIMRFWSRDNRYLKLLPLLVFILGNVLIAGAWFGINWISNGPDFIMAFLKYQAQLLTESVAGHKGFPGYHFAVTLFGVFPASLMALGALAPSQKSDDVSHNQLRLLMIILLVVVLVLFSLVQSKIVHYSSMSYYPVSFLCAWVLARAIDGNYKWPAWLLALAVTVWVFILFTLAALPWIGHHIEWFKSSFTFDAFTRSALEADVRWSSLDYLPAIFTLVLGLLFFWLWRNHSREKSVIALFTGMALFVNISLIFFIGKIERYSQHAAITFCESKSGEHVEIKTIGFKSYLPYFYAKKPVPDSTLTTNQDFFILRTDKRSKLDELPNLDILYEKNGFIFLVEK